MFNILDFAFFGFVYQIERTIDIKKPAPQTEFFRFGPEISKKKKNLTPLLKEGKAFLDMYTLEGNHVDFIWNTLN